MNRRRNEPRPSGLPIRAMILSVAISCAGGVLYVYYKNRQICVERETTATRSRIEHERFEIRNTEMRMEQMLNRFLIRKQLEANGSTLHPIAAAVVEEIELAPQGKRTVAAAD